MGSPNASQSAALAQEDAGYHKGLKPRQIQMIAIGGCMGTGLFMGTGGRLHAGGPALFLVYALCGVFVYFVMRALGELVMHRPSSGSFVSYAREFLGEKAAFVAGWLYFRHWAATSIVDVTAIGLTCATGSRFGLSRNGFWRWPRWPSCCDEHDLGQGVRRNGVLGRPGQGRRADRLLGLRLRISWQADTTSTGSQRGSR